MKICLAQIASFKGDIQKNIEKHIVYVKEAIYLDDPDKNGVELYWDKPKELWPHKADGTIEMYTYRLDLDDLLKELV